MYRLTIVTFSFLLCEKVLAASIDQRQTGDLNVQIDLKNLNIFALTKGKEEYVDYDYAYDYSEMTIKPQNGTNRPTTTVKPLNITETVTETDKERAATTELTTLAYENNTSISTEAAEVTEIVNGSSTTLATVSGASISVTTTNYNAPTTLPNCKKGFFRNSKGNCELKLQNPSNTLLKMLQQFKTSSGYSKS